MMDQEEKERYKLSRELKLTDDTINRGIVYSKKYMSKHNKMQDKKQGQRNEEPFYERLRREDNVRQKEKRRKQVEKRQMMSHAAAFYKGECMLDTKNFEDYSKEDEKKADIECKIRNQKEDERAELIQSQHKKKMMSTSL